MSQQDHMNTGGVPFLVSQCILLHRDFIVVKETIKQKLPENNKNFWKAFT